MCNHYASLADRLAANSIASPTGCRLWTGNCNNGGYPRFTKRVDGKVAKVYAHRAAWELEYAVTVPAGLELDHVCVTPECIEPSHLEPVTKAVNLALRDSRRAAQMAEAA